MRKKKSFHFHTFKSTFASTFRSLSTSIQLHTSDETPIMTLKPPRSKYTENDRSNFSLRASISSESYKNVIQKHKKSSKRPVFDLVTRPKNDFTELFETSQTPLKITNIRPKKDVLSADLNKDNIIQKRRTRQPNTRYADLVYVI